MPLVIHFVLVHPSELIADWHMVSIEQALAEIPFRFLSNVFDKPKARSRRFQNSPFRQVNVTVQLNLLILMVLTGHGYLFFGYALT